MSPSRSVLVALALASASQPRFGSSFLWTPRVRGRHVRSKPAVAEHAAFGSRSRYGCGLDDNLLTMAATKVPMNAGEGEKTSAVIAQRLATYFQGDFDNYHQVVQDRKNGLLPKDGGGHEHIHCSLVPLGTKARLAAFYFDGKPDKIFRFRYYEIVCEPETSGTSARHVDMNLYTLHPNLLRQLKERSEEPSEWPRIFRDFKNAGDHDGQVLTLLSDCEIRWSVETDPEQHAYLEGFDEDSSMSNCLHAVMVQGEAVVDSQMAPGKKIRIMDQLSLYPDSFYINDRGFDPTTGEYIYGNQREIPYRLDRVANWITINDDDGETTPCRCIVDQSLGWTMGNRMRTKDEYGERSRDIGGP